MTDINLSYVRGTLSAHVASSLVADDRRIVVTGAGGWLGLATLDLLSAAFGREFRNRVCCFGSSARRLELFDGTWIDQDPLAEMARLENRPSILFHFAFLTKDRAEEMDEAAYRASNVALRETVLGAVAAIGVDAIFVASSGAASFADSESVSAAMRLYGSLKRDDEDAFSALARANDITAVIGRIFNIAGPYINKHNAYALAAFINDGLEHRPIRVLAPHRVVRTYVAIRELMSLVISLLLTKPGITRFDSGGDPLELGEIAALVAAVVGGGSVDRKPTTNATADVYVGNGEFYRQLLDRSHISPVPLQSQISETAGYLAALRAQH